MLEPETKPTNARWRVADGLVFEEYNEPDGNIVGQLEAFVFPSPVLLHRDPERAHYSFRSDWFLPDPVEPPARFTTLIKAMEQAAKSLSPAALEGQKLKKRPAPKPVASERPKVLREEFRFEREGIICIEKKYSDERLVWELQAPHLFSGELHLTQPTRQHHIFQITQRPRGMIIGDHWSSPERLAQHLSQCRKSDLF